MSVERMMTAKSIVAFHANANRVTLDTVDCSLCGSPDYSLYDSVDEWRIVRCDRCGFCFTNPRPSVESLPYFYDLGYFRDDEVTRFGWVDEERDPHGARSNDYHQRIADIESRLDNRGRLLELGAATGEFLSVMRARGWKVDGVELSRDAVEAARRNREINLFCGSLEQFETRESYDVVCMYHSLEHTPNPAFVIARSYELLNPDGIIVIEVPNLKGFDARINRGRRLLSYDLPRHLSHFTPAILAKQLEKNSFEILDVDSYYPNFILRLVETLAAPKGTGDRKTISESGNGSSSQSGIEPPMARSGANWKTRLLKRTSELFPGWRFTIVARK